MTIQLTQKLALVATLAADPPPSLPLPLLLDLVFLPSPHTVSLVSSLLSTDATLIPQLDTVITQLAARLGSPKAADDVYAAASILRAVADAHDQLAAAVLAHAALVPSLRHAYDFLNALSSTPVGSDTAGGSSSDTDTPAPEASRLAVLRAKSAALLLARTLRTLMSFAAGSEALNRLMGAGPGPGPGGSRLLLDRTLEGDMDVFDGVYVDEAILDVLREIDVVECIDPRFDSLRELFPRIPPYLLVKALRHVRYTPPASSNPLPSPAPAHAQPTTAATQALIDALLGGGGSLPPELADVGAAAATSVEAGAAERRRECSEEDGGWGSTQASPARIERSNIWNDAPLDISRLRLKDDAPTIGADIPSTLRDSILRLVEAQADEAAAERRALDEARGVVRRPAGGLGAIGEDDGEDADEDGAVQALGKVVRVGAKEGSDSEGEGYESEAGTSSLRSASPAPQQTRERSVQTTLELAYIRYPTVFDRDSATKRGEPRRRLRELTGWDDGQIEGWRIMLERNPHKDAILGQHQWAAPSNRAASGPAAGQGQRGGKPGQRGGRGGSGGGGGGGRGSSGGGRGSSRASAPGSSRASGAGTPSARTAGTGTTGGGRGRGSKGSRGHQNAARVRGHDRKMARGGAVWD